MDKKKKVQKTIPRWFFYLFVTLAIFSSSMMATAITVRKVDSAWLKYHKSQVEILADQRDEMFYKGIFAICIGNPEHGGWGQSVTWCIMDESKGYVNELHKRHVAGWNWQLIKDIRDEYFKLQHEKKLKGNNDQDFS